MYSESAVLIYVENVFAFQQSDDMQTWLAKRILAQRQAIQYLMLPCCEYFIRGRRETKRSELIYRKYKMRKNPFVAGKMIICAKTKKMCPNLVTMIGENLSREIFWEVHCDGFEDY